MAITLTVLARMRALQRDAEDFGAPMQICAADCKAFGDHIEMQDKLLRAARRVLLVVGQKTPMLDRTRAKLLGELDDVLGP